MNEFQSDVIALLKRVYPFRELEESDQAWIAEAGEVLSFDPGQDFYDQGQPVEYFYFILKGDVNLNFYTGKMNVSMGILQVDDQFGFEVFDRQAVYLTSAFATTEGMLFRMHRESIEAMVKTLPELALALQMQAHSLRLSLEVPLDWRQPKDLIFYIDRRHPYFLWARIFLPIIAFTGSLTVLAFLAFINLPGTLLPGFAAGVVGFLSGLWLIWNYVDWSNDYSIITNQAVIFQERVVLLYDSRQEAPLNAIQSSKIESSQIGRLVGFGDLILKTFTGTLAFPDVRHPEVIANLLDDRRKRVEHLNQILEHKRLKKMIRQGLRFAPEDESKEAPTVKQLKPGSLAAWLANLFRMRWEQNDVITYRKHWFILLKKILFPAFLLFLWIVFTLLDLFHVVPVLDTKAMVLLGVVGFLFIGFWCWYIYADWSNDKYIVSDDQIIDVYKKPLGSEEKQVAPIKSIQSVEIEKIGFLNQVLNLGTVYIRIGDTRSTFDTVYDPSDVQRDLFLRIDRYNYNEKKRQEDATRLWMVDAVEAYHEVVGDPYQRTEKDEIRRIGDGSL